MEFIQKYRFDNLGVFAFSCEEGTAAERLPHQCRCSTAQRRCDSIMLLQGQLAHKNNKRREGKIYKTLAEGFDEEQQLWYGRTEFLAPEIDGKVYFSGHGVLPGNFYNVLMEEAFGYDFFGRVME
jgi:ribosomal protein S12 methylthiotransferase rimO